MEGNYNITMRTPLGPQNGRIGLRVANGKLNGFLNILGGENPFTGGKVNGNSFEFSGAIKAAGSKFNYTVKGTVNGSVLKAEATTQFGVLQIMGNRAYPA